MTGLNKQNDQIIILKKQTVALLLKKRKFLGLAPAPEQDTLAWLCKYGMFKLNKKIVPPYALRAAKKCWQDKWNVVSSGTACQPEAHAWQDNGYFNMFPVTSSTLSFKE